MVDIRATFLESRTLDRDVFMKPSPDIMKEGVIWKLMKPLYGLAVPIYLKSKTISRVCYSSKDAKMFNVATMMEDAIFAARQVEILIFGDYRRRIKVRLFRDLEPM